MIDGFGTEEQRSTWIPRLASCRPSRPTASPSRAPAPDAAALATRAERDGDEYVLTGVKQFISGAGRRISTSSWRALAARTKGHLTFLVEKDCAGLEFPVHKNAPRWAGTPSPPRR